jgi:hypothetical protein
MHLGAYDPKAIFCFRRKRQDVEAHSQPERHIISRNAQEDQRVNLMVERPAAMIRP